METHSSSTEIGSQCATTRVESSWFQICHAPQGDKLLRFCVVYFSMVEGWVAGR